MKELSVFVDESGDFGNYDSHSPIYLFSLVFHDQKDDISSWIDLFKRELARIDAPGYFHGGPLIRREEDYKNVDIHLRRRIFNKMSFLTNHLSFRYAVILAEKKEMDEGLGLSFSLAKPFGRMLRDHLSFFQSFDVVKVYYDNGQKELSNLLIVLFGAFVNAVEFKTVNPRDYVLFQVADYLSTLELVHRKIESKAMSKSEIYFFGTPSDFNRNYYRHIQAKKL